MKSEHKRMSRMPGHSLTLGIADAWSGFSFVAAVKLSETERAALVFSDLNALDLDRAEMTAAASIGSAGVPLPCSLAVWITLGSGLPSPAAPNSRRTPSHPSKP